MANTQLANALSIQQANLKALMDAANALKASRQLLDIRLATAGELAPEDFAEMGHGHVTMSRITAMKEAMDVLDASFSSAMPVSNKPPAMAILEMIP